MVAATTTTTTWLILLISAILSQVVVKGYSYNFGLLVAQTPGRESELFCIKYYPELHDLATTAEKAPKYNIRDLENLENVDTCNSESVSRRNLTNKIALVSSHNNTFNCSIAQRAEILEVNKAVAVLADGSVFGQFNASEYKINITVASLKDTAKKEELLDIKKSHPNAKFLIYSPDFNRRFDPSILLMLFMAVFTVALGSLWSGYTKHHLRMKKLELLQGRESDENRQNRPQQEQQQQRQHHQQQQMSGHHPNEDVSLRVSPFLVIAFVVCMCIMLVLLYFFFDKLVYVIIAMFCIASTIATYSCFEPLVMWSYSALPFCPTFRLPRCNISCCNFYVCNMKMELRQFLLLLIAISLSGVWFVFRKTEWSWILQDILGILFSINMLKVLRLPSFKICVLLLSTLFVYDIFFVFITPLITADGKSIMVEVATGGSTGEQLPMVLRVPYFNEEPMRVCWSPYSMLGFGDILVPGLLLSYCHSFDLLVGNQWKIYWLITNIAYILGLLATFVSLYLMDSAQPALLYLVPFTVIPTAIVAFIRGDLKAMWDGDLEPANPENPNSDSSN